MNDPNTTIIKYDWPSLYVPKNVTLSQYIREKFQFFSNQIFLTDSSIDRQYLYRHVQHDSVQVYRILKSTNSLDNSKTPSPSTTINQKRPLTIGIVGYNNFEHVTTIFGALLAEATIVLLDSNCSQEQISTAVKQCKITKLAVLNRSTSQQPNVNKLITHLKQQHKMSYTISFKDINEIDLNNNINTENNKNETTYFVDDSDRPNQTKDYQMSIIHNQQNCDQRVCFVVPKFKGKKLVKMYQINEYSLISQLTYASLPQCGFEWNINDIVLNMKPFSDLLGILELLVTLSVGARIVINSSEIPQTIDSFTLMLAQYPITACIVDSSYLVGLIKSNLNSLNLLRKLIYTKQSIHQNIVNVFRKKFHNCHCRYGYYLLEASGFVAIEILNHSGNFPISIAPLPLMEIMVMNRHNRQCSAQGALGKIFIRTPYRSRVVVTNQKRHRSGEWIYTGQVGYYDQSTCLQVIDHYRNFIKHGTNFISKNLLETILLSCDRVENALVLRINPAVNFKVNNNNKNNNNNQPKTFQALVKLKNQDNDFSTKELDKLLDGKQNLANYLTK